MFIVEEGMPHKRTGPCYSSLVQLDNKVGRCKLQRTTQDYKHVKCYFNMEQYYMFISAIVFMFSSF